jgi:bifunctional non-homologous end joining protein LigD
MALNEYRKKRDFQISPEPSGEKTAPKAPKSSLIYVVQKHRASQLHYDFRLEYRGTLLSWAIPKGPSLDPSVKRLAMQVEDHPVEYASFEGVIPEGEYGGGTVMVWDQGTWTPESPDVAAALEKGDLKFTVHGKKLKGSWVLVRTHGYGSRSKSSWLLIKHRDEFASPHVEVTEEMPRSAVSNRLLAEIARDGGGDAEKAATGDPVNKPAGKTPKGPKPSRSSSAKNSRASARKAVKARTTKRRKSSS